MKMRPTAPILVLLLLACAAPAAAQPAAAVSSGDAAYYFLLGRRHESTGDIDKAVAAFKQALALAPESAELRAELAGIERDAGVRRRRRGGEPTVALVGYTNAGKSSWMRALTGSGVLVEDKLFATLDTTVRALRPEGVPRILVSDTVGFIKKLPHDLVASFRSTLEEARDCELLVHVVDASDPSFPAQIEVTREVLAEIGAAESPRLVVLNKADRLDPAARQRLAQEWPDALLLSARDPADVDVLRERIRGFFERDAVEAELRVPYARQRLVGEIHGTARVLAETHDERGTLLRVRARPEVLAKLRAKLAEP
jgi:GTP-binding protein HflX